MASFQKNVHEVSSISSFQLEGNLFTQQMSNIVVMLTL